MARKQRAPCCCRCARSWRPSGTQCAVSARTQCAVLALIPSVATLQVRPELVSVGHSVRKAALAVPLLGWFARTPAEDEALQRDAARQQRRGRSARDQHDDPTAPPPPGKQ
jgi:hypothetical protein